MTDNQQHIYSERVEAIRQAILEACADHDVTREQLLKDLLLWEEIEEHLSRTTKKDRFRGPSLGFQTHRDRCRLKYSPRYFVPLAGQS